MAKKKQPDSTPPPMAEMLDLKEAAEFLKVSKPTFYRWLAQGKISGTKAGQQWRFQRADLERFLQSDPTALPEVVELRAAVVADRAARGLAPLPWAEAAPEEEIPRFVEAIIKDAVRSLASDIHLDVERDAARVRYRIDGVLHETLNFPKEAAKAVVARIKIMADMDINERRIPQNGRIHAEVDGLSYDFRITTCPAIFGESMIARILDQSSVMIGLDQLGMTEEMRMRFEEQLRVPQGMLIATGASGSGKTTTLYSALHAINNPRIKIVTIEDPVEYQLRGLMQVHVNRKMGLTFPVAVRTFARCDPDVIMVGELRDMETISVSLAAAMTGHLVLTTMHSADTAAAVTRMLDVGAEPFMVASAVSAVIAQCLVRRICPECRQPYQPSPEVLRRLEEEAGEALSQATFSRGAGCANCHGWGYRGRIGLFELMVLDEPLRELVVRRAPASELREAARQGGMVTLLQDGLHKAAAGHTTIEEVLRVLTLSRT